MLQQISIQNFATIERLSVDFSNGLNVLTGETGAGKSILIDALNLVLGGRADGEWIRSGEATATIDALFHITDPATLSLIDEMGFPVEDGALVLKRILSSEGKNRVFINGSPATVATLCRIGNHLVDIHGQHDHQTLMQTECHVDLLDHYGRCLPERDRFTGVWEQYQKSMRTLEQMQNRGRDRLQRLDVLRFQIGEIDEAALTPDEEDNLRSERNRLQHAEKLAGAMERLKGLLSENEGSIVEQLGHARNELNVLPRYDEALGEVAQRCDSVYFEIEDLAAELDDYARSLQFDPGRLEEIEDRLALIEGLKRKYGVDVASVLEYRETIGEEYEALTSGEEQMEKLQAQILEDRQQVAGAAIALAEKREQGAKEMEKNIKKQLAELNMKQVRFAVRFDYEEHAEAFVAFRKKNTVVHAKGLGTVEFMFSSNPGEDPKPLAKIASGGELSRVMLALKTILNEVDGIPVLVFDEVDAGIGGNVAQKTGMKLKKLAGKKQVFCITHLPQIAGFAQTHFRVQKKVSGNRTKTEIALLSEDERVREIARMSGGETITEATLNHAREMIR